MNPDKTFLPGAAKTFRLRPLLSDFAPLSFAATNSLRDGGKKMKSQLVAAADRAAMSVAYGQEAADHYGIQYGFIRSVRD
ncbi:hypothetical protein ABVJ26_004462 [Salmonella enterica]|nr:hypothetical protein [Salmonella enterica]